MKTVLIYALNISLIFIAIGLFVFFTIIVARVDGWLVAAIFDFICIVMCAAVMVHDVEKEKRKGGDQ